MKICNKAGVLTTVPEGAEWYIDIGSYPVSFWKRSKSKRVWYKDTLVGWKPCKPSFVPKMIKI